jgi:hypothetical protein
MRTHLVWLLKQPPFTSFYLLLFLEGGHYDNWMSKMHSYMECLMKRFICINLLVLKTQTDLIMCASLIELCMV